MAQGSAQISGNDHSLLSGLGDDDHAAYVAKALVDGAAGNSTPWLYTNTSYADLDATTGAQGDAKSVSIVTGTRALVCISAEIENDTGGAYTVMGFRISGATTLVTSAANSIVYQQGTVDRAVAFSRMFLQTGLTAGTNVFELQARVSTGTGRIKHTDLIVIPL